MMQHALHIVPVLLVHASHGETHLPLLRHTFRRRTHATVVVVATVIVAVV